MKTLAIDFASHEGHIACVEGDAVRAIRIMVRVQEHELIDALDASLREAKWDKRGIERIACNLGPGGFTSVRGGVAFANALADGLGVPLAGYHGSALSLARSDANFWLHSTKAEALFALGGPWPEPTLVTLADVRAAMRPGTTVAGDLMEEHRTALAAVGASFPAASPLQAVLPAFSGALTYGKEPLVPWYGRGI